MNARIARTSVAAIVAFGYAHAPQQQQPLQIDGSPLCAPRCRIELRRVAAVGSPSDAILLSPWSIASIDSRGNLYAAPTTTPGAVAVFDSTGRYMRALGRGGRGPGEIMTVSYHMVIPGDTLQIIDGGGRRNHKVPLRGGETVSIPLNLNTGSVRVLPTGEIVGRASPSVGVQPIAVFGRDGTTRPRTAALPAADKLPVIDVSVVVPDSGSVWQLAGDRYLLEQWSLDGRRLRSIARNAPWFTRGEESLAAASGQAAGVSRLYDAVVLPGGRLWTFSTRSDSAFRALAPGEARDPATMQNLVDTQIELLDIGHGLVVASQRFSQYLHPVQGTRYVYSVRYTGDQIIALDLYELRFVDQEAR